MSASSLAPDTRLRTTAFTDAHGEAASPRRTASRCGSRCGPRPTRLASSPPTAPSTPCESSFGPAERATGEVVAARGGDAIAGADVTLYTDLGVRRARTDAQGAFALAELAPGSARLGVRAPGFAPATRVVAIPDSGGRRPFAIPRVELAAEGTVEGDVVDARGDPVAGARVAKDDVPDVAPRRRDSGRDRRDRRGGSLRAARTPRGDGDARGVRARARARARRGREGRSGQDHGRGAGGHRAGEGRRRPRRPRRPAAASRSRSARRTRRRRWSWSRSSRAARRSAPGSRRATCCSPSTALASARCRRRARS